ncbi:MAG: hypothetical protein KKC75_05210 [Nanoarchaeota archaeon]|nr:hypothetical protein [Nanoarchaeota archaeon]
MKKILVLVMLILTVSIAGCLQTPSGGVTAGCPEYKCDFKPRDISFELGSTQDGGKGIMGSTARIPLTNKADIGAVFQVTIDCKTLNKLESLRSEPMYIRPGDTYNFNINFNSGFGENWECNNYKVAYEGGNECVLTKT